MAGLVYRKKNLADAIPQTKLYGFNRLPSSTVQSITKRLSSTPTVNERVRSANSSHFDPLFQQAYAVCPHISCEKDDECFCVRAVGGREAKITMMRRFTRGKSADRQRQMTQKLQRPTTATSSKIRPKSSVKLEEMRQQQQLRPKTATSTIMHRRYTLYDDESEEREQLIARLQQPTEAFRHKRWNGRCWYCDG